MTPGRAAGRVTGKLPGCQLSRTERETHAFICPDALTPHRRQNSLQSSIFTVYEQNFIPRRGRTHMAGCEGLNSCHVAEGCV